MNASKLILKRKKKTFFTNYESLFKYLLVTKTKFKNNKSNKNNKIKE